MALFPRISPSVFPNLTKTLGWVFGFTHLGTFFGTFPKPKQVHFIGIMIGIWSGLAYFELLSSLPMGRRVGAKIPTSESFFQQGPMKGSYQSPGNKQHCIGHFGMEIVDPPWATMTKHCLLTLSQKWRLKPTLETPALTLESLATKCHQM